MKTLLPNQTQRAIKTLLLGVALASLTACGSSDPVEQPVVIEPDVPVAAATSIPALLSFANTKLAVANDVDDPLDTGNNELASSETEEPDPSV